MALSSAYDRDASACVSESPRNFGEMAKKQKKQGAEGINSRLQLVMKSGKVHLGLKTTIHSLRTGKGVEASHLACACNECSEQRHSRKGAALAVRVSLSERTGKLCGCALS